MNKPIAPTPSSLELSAASAAVLSRAPRVAELRFSRIDALEADIFHHDICMELLVAQIGEQLTEVSPLVPRLSQQLPPRDQAVWTRALRQVRQRLRLNHELRLYTWLPERDMGHVPQALSTEDGFDILIPPSLLEGCCADELAYHIGVALYKALAPRAATIGRVLSRGTLLKEESRLALYEWGRFIIYAASCYGLLACGNREVATRATWRQCFGVPSPLSADELRAAAAEQLTGEQGSMLELLRLHGDKPLYLNVLPELLRLFDESALCRELHGQSGGLDRAAFEKAVGLLDQQLYGGDLQGSDDLILHIIASRVLSMIHVASASEDFSIDEIYERMQDEFEDREGFDNLIAHLDPQPHPIRGVARELRSLRENGHSWALQFSAFNTLMNCSGILLNLQAVQDPAHQEASARLDDIIVFHSIDHSMAYERFRMLFQSAIEMGEEG